MREQGWGRGRSESPGGAWRTGSLALSPWAGGHWLAGTAPSERGLLAAWVCLRRERGRRGDPVRAAP